MTLAELIEMFSEDAPYGFRPDDSGIRGKGVNRPTLARASDFPYDKQPSYGEPDGYDRGSTGHGGFHGIPTPKDDQYFSLTLKDLEEVLGAPILLMKGGSSNLGSSVPGSAGNWSNDPPKAWDEDEMDESPLNIDPRPPDTEITPSSWAPDHRDQTDDDLENRMNRIWGQDDNQNFVIDKPDAHVMGPDPFTAIASRLSSRGLFGLMPKESAWDRAEKLARHTYRTGDWDDENEPR